MDCPACPQPGKNLITNSTDRLVPTFAVLNVLHILLTTILSSWINTLYLSIDANFKLKQKDRGFTDPPLANGLSYMVADCTLKEHLDECERKRLNHEVNSVDASPLVATNKLHSC